MLGYTESELAEHTLPSLTHPGDLVRNEALFVSLRAGEIDEYALDKRFISKNGIIVYAHVAARAVRNADGSLAYTVALIEDTTSHKQMEERDCLRSHALEQMARGATLTDVLLDAVHGIETVNPHLLSSILLLDEDGGHLRVVAAPSLPDFYNEAIDGLCVGVGNGSCGTTAYIHATGRCGRHCNTSVLGELPRRCGQGWCPAGRSQFCLPPVVCSGSLPSINVNGEG